MDNLDLTQQELEEEYEPRLRLIEIGMNRLLSSESPWQGSFSTNDIKLQGSEGKVYRVPNMVFFGKSNANEVIKWLKEAAGIYTIGQKLVRR
jgi:hypothetical protein